MPTRTGEDVVFRLRDAIGFVATDTRGRRLGRIEELVEPGTFVLRSGLLGRRVSLLETDEVLEVLPLLRVVVVSGGGPSFA